MGVKYVGPILDANDGYGPPQRTRPGSLPKKARHDHARTTAREHDLTGLLPGFVGVVRVLKVITSNMSYSNMNREA